MGTDSIFKYFPELSERQKEQFEALKAIYEDWNAKINVISRKDMDNFYIHHVLHSLSIAKLVRFKDFTEIMDAGTGGGFPGIPLAIMFPEAKFYLADSIGKKIKVVREVVNNLRLSNVEAEQIRMEQVDLSFDFIISRAVTALPEFVKWTSYKFHSKSFNSVPNGILYLKGGEIREELKQVKRLKKKIYPIQSYFPEPFFQTKSIIHLY